MFTVRVDDVLRAAKVGRDNGTVAAFHPDFQKVGREQLQCTYRYKGRPGVGCAVGVGFNDEQAAIISKANLNDATVVQLARNTVKFVGKVSILAKLQAFHDAILNQRSNGMATAGRVKIFDNYLNKQLALLPPAA